MIPRDSRLTRHPDCLTNGVHLKGRIPACYFLNPFAVI
jgi:hypothetical protein